MGDSLAYIIDESLQLYFYSVLYFKIKLTISPDFILLDLMVSALDSGSNGPESNAGWVYCAMLLGKKLTLDSQ